MDAVLSYISSYRFIFTLCVTAVTVVVWLLLRHMIHRFTDRITGEGTLSGRKHTYLTLSLNLVRGILVVIALMLVLQIHGVNVSSLITGLGIVGAIVGLALQDMLKDVIMGCNILTGEFYVVGDVVKYGDLVGEVIQFSLRSTKIRDLATDNIVTISNRNVFEVARVSNEVFVTIPTSYEDDPTAVESFMEELVEEIRELDDVEDCVFLGLKTLNKFSVDYLFCVFAAPTVHNAVRRRVQGLARHRFAEKGFTIPYPQMDIHTSH